jgi:hypothetical protein
MNVAVPAANQPLYKSLFLSPLQPVGPTPDANQPQRPLVDFEIHSVNGNGDGTGGTYENWVNLRGSYCGQFGWYNRATAVDSLALYVVSRASGYPKVLADKIQITKTANGWKAVTTQLGKPLVTLEWRKDDARLAELLAENPWAKDWTKGHGHAYDAPAWAFEPYPNSGPFVKWIATKPDPKTPQIWDSRVGVMKVTVAQDADPTLTEGNWMGLVPKTIEVPGMVEHYKGKGEFIAHRDDCKNPDAPPPSNGGPGGGPGTSPKAPGAAKCAKASARVRLRSIGPAQLGWTRKRLVKRLGKPTGSSHHGAGWCLRRGGALLAAFNSHHRVRALATTHVSKRLRKAHRRAHKLNRRLYLAHRRSTARVFGVRKRRVRFVVIARARTLERGHSRRRILRDLGL